MKRWTLFFAAFFLLLCFVGCSKTPTEPESSIIEADLQNQLNNYCMQNDSYSLDIIEYETVRSLSEEKTYSAQLYVTAHSRYAAHYFNAEITYTLYDQGWMLDHCEWEASSFEIISYPNETELSQLIAECESLIGQTANLEFNYGESSVSIIGTKFFNWKPYVTGEEKYTAIWNYDVSSDQWIYDDTYVDDCTFSMSSDFWKELKLADSGATISIKDANEKGFNISIEDQWLYLDSVHVDFSNVSFQRNGAEMRIIFTNNDVDFTIKQYDHVSNGRLEIYLYLYQDTLNTAGNPFWDMPDMNYNVMLDYAIYNRSSYGLDGYSGMSYCMVELTD